jgi:hypothetical protein
MPDTVDSANIIEVRSQRYTLDWVAEEVHKIDMSKIAGFDLHWRGDSWHIVVVERHKVSNDTYAPLYSYDLNHWVFPGEAKKLFNNPAAVIRKIVNDRGSKNFQKELQKLLTN